MLYALGCFAMLLGVALWVRALRGLRRTVPTDAPPGLLLEQALGPVLALLGLVLFGVEVLSMP